MVVRGDQRVAQQHRNRHRPDPARHWRNRTRNRADLGKGDIAHQPPLGLALFRRQAVDADVDHGRARLDPVPAHHFRAADGGHHDLFLLQTPDKKVGLNHVAFAVRDIHEVFGGGLHFDRCGWKTQLGPGRHPISSAYFWYFVNPAGGLIEYYADEDQLTDAWEPREFEPGPTRFAEWAVDGGLDGNTRRQKNVAAPEGKFLTDRK